jgi:hypothetical protein
VNRLDHRIVAVRFRGFAGALQYYSLTARERYAK